MCYCCVLLLYVLLLYITAVMRREGVTLAGKSAFRQIWKVEVRGLTRFTRFTKHAFDQEV
jgi:hypothetical protein